MLRITTHEKPDSLTFQLEGKLAGPWVKELADCWQMARAGAGLGNRVVRVDLNGVTFLDADGMGLLNEMHAGGAEFVCSGCLMRAVVAEITSPATCARVEPDKEVDTL